MKLRKLRASEVKFEIKIEPECIGVSGNVVATDDPEADEQAETEIVGRLNDGFVEAWCVVVVVARWKHVEGRDTLGGCSFETAGLHVQIEECVEAHGMRETALAALNAELTAYARTIAPLVRKPAKVKSARRRK